MIKGIDKPEEPPRIAVKFANIIFILGILYSVLIIIYLIYRIYSPIYEAYLENKEIQIYYNIFIFCGVISASLFSFGLKLNNNLKVNLSLFLTTAGIFFYLFEIYLEFNRETPHNERISIAEKLSIPFDTRTPKEVLKDLNSLGIEASYFNPSMLIKSNGLQSSNGRIYPLGGISNFTTILSNESGYYPIIETDEHGFNNPKGLYEKNKVDIMLTGDSFTEGKSVHSNETIGAVLRQWDFNAISVGKAGNGSLLELAALKEYAEPLQPKIVLWLYYRGDIVSDLSSEFGSTILRNYLIDFDFTQNLISRQAEIDKVLKNNWIKEKFQNHWSFRILKLYNLRLSINSIRIPKTTIKIKSKSIPYPMNPVEKKQIQLFKKIMKISNNMISKWEGKLYFVYLPSYHKYGSESENPVREDVLRLVNQLEIPIIDIHEKVFASHPDPLSLFPLRVHGHYTKEGYRLVAEAIGKRLEVDGYVPIKLRE